MKLSNTERHWKTWNSSIPQIGQEAGRFPR